MLPVLVMNPSGAKGKKMAKKRNPAMRLGLKDLALAFLGGVAVGGVAYALDGTNMGRYATGAIKMATGALVGGGVAMASKPIGLGIAGGGAATGINDIGGEALAGMAKPAASSTSDDKKELQAVRAQLRAVRAGGARRQLPASPNAQRAAVNQRHVVEQFAAIRARL